MEAFGELFLTFAKRLKTGFPEYNEGYPFSSYSVLITGPLKTSAKGYYSGLYKPGRFLSKCWGLGCVFGV